MGTSIKVGYHLATASLSPWPYWWFRLNENSTQVKRRHHSLSRLVRPILEDYDVIGNIDLQKIDFCDKFRPKKWFIVITVAFLMTLELFFAAEILMSLIRKVFCHGRELWKPDMKLQRCTSDFGLKHLEKLQKTVKYAFSRVMYQVG